MDEGNDSAKKGRRGVGVVDESPRPSSAISKTATTTKSKTSSSYGNSLHAEPQGPTQLPRISLTPAIQTGSMNAPDDNGESLSSAATKVAEDPLPSAQVAGGPLPPTKQYDFLKGKLDPSRYSAKHGWLLWNKDPEVDGPPRICKGTATISASYYYTDNDGKNKLPDGFAITPDYARAVTKTLFAEADKRLKESGKSYTRPSVLELGPSHSLVSGGKQWIWFFESQEASNPQVVWAFIQQQVGEAGVRNLFADYLASMSRFKMRDGKCDANGVCFHFGKWPLEDNVGKSSRVSGVALEDIDSFQSLPVRKESLRIMLELRDRRSRSISPLRLFRS